MNEDLAYLNEIEKEVRKQKKKKVRARSFSDHRMSREWIADFMLTFGIADSNENRRDLKQIFKASDPEDVLDCAFEVQKNLSKDDLLINKIKQKFLSQGEN